MSNIALPTDLVTALSQLDEELAEGDITTKGYLKRRTQLFASTGLSTYLEYDNNECSGQQAGGSLNDEDATSKRQPTVFASTSDLSAMNGQHARSSEFTTNTPSTSSSSHSNHSEEVIPEDFDVQDYLYRPSDSRSSTLYDVHDSRKHPSRGSSSMDHLLRLPANGYMFGDHQGRLSRMPTLLFFIRVVPVDEDENGIYSRNKTVVLQGDLPEVRGQSASTTEVHPSGPQMSPLDARGLPFAIHDPRKAT